MEQKFGITWSHQGEGIAQTGYVYLTVDAATKDALKGPERVSKEYVKVDGMSDKDFSRASWAEIETENETVASFSIAKKWWILRRISVMFAGLFRLHAT